MLSFHVDMFTIKMYQRNTDSVAKLSDSSDEISDLLL